MNIYKVLHAKRTYSKCCVLHTKSLSPLWPSAAVTNGSTRLGLSAIREGSHRGRWWQACIFPTHQERSSSVCNTSLRPLVGLEPDVLFGACRESTVGSPKRSFTVWTDRKHLWKLSRVPGSSRKAQAWGGSQFNFVISRICKTSPMTQKHEYNYLGAYWVFQVADRYHDTV